MNWHHLSQMKDFSQISFSLATSVTRTATCKLIEPYWAMHLYAFKQVNSNVLGPYDLYQKELKRHAVDLMPTAGWVPT